MCYTIETLKKCSTVKTVNRNKNVNYTVEIGKKLLIF